MMKGKPKGSYSFSPGFAEERDPASNNIRFQSSFSFRLARYQFCTLDGSGDPHFSTVCVQIGGRLLENGNLGVAWAV